MTNLNLSILELQQKIVGNWQNDDLVYSFYPIEQAGVSYVDILKNGERIGRQIYSIEQNNGQFLLTRSNLEFAIQSIDEKELLVFGPLVNGSGGGQDRFVKL